MHNEPRWVRIIQSCGMALFSVFVFGVISWIIGLIRLSWRLNDNPSGSIAISIIAIPVFLLLLGVAHYVFWGIRESDDEEHS